MNLRADRLGLKFPKARLTEEARLGGQFGVEHLEQRSMLSGEPVAESAPVPPEFMPPTIITTDQVAPVVPVATQSFFVGTEGGSVDAPP